LCLVSNESIPHLLWERGFTTLVWQHELKGIEHCFRNIESWKSLFGKWVFMYKGSFKNNPLLKRIWITLPKYISWKVWLARNETIFRQEYAKLEIVGNRVVALIIDYFNYRVAISSPMKQLEVEEEAWLAQFSIEGNIDRFKEIVTPIKMSWKLHLKLEVLS
jgi:hypothetical protein